MTTHHPAFTLIELLIYMVLLTIHALLIFSFINTVIMASKQAKNLERTGISTILALDVVKKDLMQAQQDPRVWDCDHGVFVKEFLDEKNRPDAVCVGWELFFDNRRGSMLRRSQGLYDFTKHAWVKRSVSMLGCSLTQFGLQVFIDKEQGVVKAAQIRYQIDQASGGEVLKVRLRNGVINGVVI